MLLPAPTLTTRFDAPEFKVEAPADVVVNESVETMPAPEIEVVVLSVTLPFGVPLLSISMLSLTFMHCRR
jgi:hypothetical protein